MKTIRLIAVFAFAAIFSISTFAQAAAQPGAGTFKIGVINTAAFDDDKGGITTYVQAMNALDAQLKPDVTALQATANKLQSLQTEIEGYKKQLEDPNPKVPIDRSKIQATAQAKYDEYQKLNLEFEYKKKDYEASAQRREQTLAAPIRVDIGNAIQEYAKQKGYALILDATKAADMILGFDEKYDVTKDFIAFYNARKPATASVATPK